MLVTKNDNNEILVNWEVPCTYKLDIKKFVEYKCLEPEDAKNADLLERSLNSYLAEEDDTIWYNFPLCAKAFILEEVKKYLEKRLTYFG